MCAKKAPNTRAHFHPFYSVLFERCSCFLYSYKEQVGGKKGSGSVVPFQSCLGSCLGPSGNENSSMSSSIKVITSNFGNFHFCLHICGVGQLVKWRVSLAVCVCLFLVLVTKHVFLKLKYFGILIQVLCTPGYRLLLNLELLKIIFILLILPPD